MSWSVQPDVAFSEPLRIEEHINITIIVHTSTVVVQQHGTHYCNKNECDYLVRHESLSRGIHYCFAMLSAVICLEFILPTSSAAV